MSIKVLVYVPSLSKPLLDETVALFAQQGMEVEFHPGFALDANRDAGKVMMRMHVDASDIPQYDDKDMASELEFSFKDFRYSSPPSVNPAINQQLKNCTKVVTVRMHATHTNSLRAGLYFVALLADVAGGIVYAPRSDAYLEPKQALAQFAQEVAAYEKDLSPADWRVVPFTGWS
jgi:hypothetical protein